MTVLSWTRLRRGLLGLAAAVVAASLVALPASGAGGPGSAGTDTAIPPTDSAVTLGGRGPFADLEVTVNQTENLVNQAVSVTWEGGDPTVETSTRFAGNFLQIFQCWGDPDGTIPENPGPPPEQCVQGASAAVPEGTGGNLLAGLTQSRIISRSGWESFDEADGVLDPRTTNLWLPFRAVDGTEIGIHTDPDFNPSIEGGNYWLNPYFNIVTTNEIPASATGPDGTGAELFEVHTGIESSGLGCGQRVLAVAGGEPRVPPCWLVVVPRGTAAEENAGTPFTAATDAEVVTSPVSPKAWQHRIAFPLEFNPLETSCSLADESRRIVGTELVVAAVSSWQAELCTDPSLPPFSYANVGDGSARRQLASPAEGGPGMVIVSRPFEAGLFSEEDPVLYAPVSLSGVVIGFTVERVPKTDAPEAEQDLAGVRVADINLTPRLVAKLLTQSYRRQVEIFEVPPGYDWLEGNPAHMGDDPDFLRFNPEFELLRITTGRNFSGLVLPAGNSDAARMVWEWILADPEAKRWLDGEADEWGMAVNPVYATTAEANLNKVAFGDPVPESFPKSDPFCHQAPPTGSTGDLVPPPLCGTDWLPYAGGFGEAARITRSGEDGAKITKDTFAVSADKIWRRSDPTLLGTRAILSLTDSASAARYGVQRARLSRAGDGGDDREFVPADPAGLTAGVDAMAPGATSDVLEPDPAAAAPGGYPLTALTYAAVAPLSLDEPSREEYAAFLDYAAGPGQEPGLELGMLPEGYAPLPEDLRAQTAEAADLLRDPSRLAPEAPPPAPPPSTASAPPPPGSDAAPVGGPNLPSAREPVPPAVDDVAAPPVDGGSDAEAAPPKSGLVTPITASSPSRFVPPLAGAVALLSALAALEVTKRPRRASAAAPQAAPAGVPGP